MEIEEQQQHQVATKRTAEGADTELARAHDDARFYRFPHFDVDPARWLAKDEINDEVRDCGFLYMHRETGRPMLLVLLPDSHYTLYYQTAPEAPQAETGVRGFCTPVAGGVNAKHYTEKLWQVDAMYAEELGQVPGDSDATDEAELARFLAQLSEYQALEQQQQGARRVLTAPRHDLSVDTRL